MAITAKAIGALEKARALERQKKWKDAWYYYIIASREKSSEGTRGVERMLRKLEDHDIIDSSEIIRDRREANTPTEKPKIVPSISVPSEEPRILIEDRSKLQQKPKVQQKKLNKSARKTKEQTDNKNGKEMQTDNELTELQKTAEAGDTDAQVTLAKELEKRKKRSEANTWWKQAADNGHPEARAKIGQWYLERALKYLGQQSILEKLEEKNPHQLKADKPESSVAPKPHFRHQRNMVSELDGCGDMAETETSVLHAEEAKETTWVGDEEKDNPLPSQVIIQEIVRHVAYWSGNDCLPPLICIDRQETEACECPLQSGHKFSAEGIVWQEIPPAVATEDASRLMKAKEEEQQPKEEEQQPKHGCMGILFLIFKKLFSFL